MAREYLDPRLADGAMALDREGRVLRRPSWYTAEEMRAAQAIIRDLYHQIDHLVTQLGIVQENARKYVPVIQEVEVEVIQRIQVPAKLMCRRRLHWILRLVLR